MKKLIAVSTAVVALVVCSFPVWAGYTDKSYHEGEHTYKHPSQRSFTGPFDYGNEETPRVAVEPSVPMGKCNCFTFDGTKSYSGNGEKLTYAWDFGDGSNSTDQNPMHTYDKVGEYTATLTVTNQKGNKGTDEIDIFVETDAGEGDGEGGGEE